LTTDLQEQNQRWLFTNLFDACAFITTQKYMAVSGKPKMILKDRACDKSHQFQLLFSRSQRDEQLNTHVDKLAKISIFFAENVAD